MDLKNQEYLNPKFVIDNLDRYVIRKLILNSLSFNMLFFHGKLLDVGCGKMPYKNYILDNTNIKEYIGIDLENALEYDSNIKPDYYWDGITLPFENSTYSTIIATEVLEHCPNPELILKEIHRVLKPGGVFFFTVPFLWNLHEVPNDEFRYTPFALKRLLKQAGFDDVIIKATGGWHASLAQMLGLWVRRSPLEEKKRKYLSLILKPAIKYLMKIDRVDQVSFKEGQMITGLNGLVRKKL